MAKKVYAVTNIKTAGNEGESTWNAGDLVDHTKFSKDELKGLLDAGAIELRDESEKTEKTEGTEETTPDPATVTSTPEEQGSADEEE